VPVAVAGTGFVAAVAVVADVVVADVVAVELVALPGFSKFRTAATSVELTRFKATLLAMPDFPFDMVSMALPITLMSEAWANAL
jgi:hypothetical protein